MKSFKPSRREALALAGGAVASVAGSTLLSPRDAVAKAPFSAAKPDAFQSFKHGDMQISVVSDGYLAFGDGRKLMIGPTIEEMGRQLEANFLAPDNMVLEENITVVNTGSKLVIIDTGMGASKMFGDTTGRLPNNLKSAGIDPAAIDAVILSHCHPDHAGGLVDAEGKSVFPNAQVYVNEEDFKFWTDEAKLSGDAKPFVELARANLLPHKDRMAFIKGGQEIVTGITAIDAPGHTVGHTVFMLTSGGKSLAVTADCGHHSVLMVETPKIEFVYDTDPKLAVQSRLKIWDMLATDRIPFIAFHFPWPGVGNLAKQGEGYRYYPSPIRQG
ncbi:MAG: MBL fold metallo-hydrolase [Alphaproteobacteria bacterium]|nr:MBL fold metallo-hydrolase [Alphaproteobacteria bacterium]